MEANRGRFLGGPPGRGFNMAGHPRGQVPPNQFVPQGMQYHMMHPGMGQMPMNPAANPQMFAMQGGFPPQMRMARPNAPPPAYTPQMAQNFDNRQRAPASHMNGKQQFEKERQFQMRQMKLKEFAKGGSRSHIGADKLIESMFGKTEKKPTPKDHPSSPRGMEESDGFGDFMQGPSNVSASPLDDSTIASTNQISANSVSQQNMDSGAPAMSNKAEVVPQPDKKDLATMMMECSDLKTPAKATLFQKPAMKDVQKTSRNTQPAAAYNPSQQSRNWANNSTLTGLFMSNDPVPAVDPSQSAERHNQSAGNQQPDKSSPSLPADKREFVPPTWCTDKDKIPSIYHHVMEASLVNGSIDTPRLYPILLLSGLPRPVLKHVWELANRGTPGQLTPPELYLLLALIAIVQNNVQVTSLDIVHRCPQPPIPFLGNPNNATPEAPKGPDVTTFTPVHPSPLPSTGFIDVSAPNGSAGANHPSLDTMPVPQPPVQAPLTHSHLLVTAQSQPVIPAHGQPIIPAHSQPVIPAHGQPVIPAHSQPVIPAHGQPVIPAHIQPVISAHDQPVIPAHGQPVIPAHSQPVIPAHGQPVIPAHSQPVISAHGQPLTLAHGPPVVPAQSQPVIPDEDFADFQTASATTIQESYGDFVENKPKSVNIPEEVKYVLSVPFPNDSAAELTSDETYSNVQNFFGSDDSSTDPNTPNSLDDDFKSADSKQSDDTSQFTSSEQSENEDFKTFDSYLENFKTKSKNKESVNKLPKISSTRPEVIPVPNSAIPVLHKPPVVLGQTSQLATSESPEFTDFKGAGSPEFAEFQTGPTPEVSLIGQEDKYAALRGFTSVIDSTENTGDAFSSNKSDDITSFNNAKNDDITSFNSSNNDDIIHEKEDDWHNFQSVPNKDMSSAIAYQSEPEQANAAKVNNVICPPASESFADFSAVASDDWSDFSSVNFNEAIKIENAPIEKAAAENLPAPQLFEDSQIPDNTRSNTNIVNIQKTHIDKDDILGILIKNVPMAISKDATFDGEPSNSDKKSFTVKQSNFDLMDDIDIDIDRVPPPMDFSPDDQDGEFTAFPYSGEHVEDMTERPTLSAITTKYAKNMFGESGPVGFGAQSSFQKVVTQSKAAEQVKNDTHSQNLSGNMFDGENMASFKEDSPGEKREEQKEDSQSVSSIPSIQDMDAGGDSRSISSSEYTAPMESKSVDSLDLYKQDATQATEDQEDQETGLQTAASSDKGLKIPAEVEPNPVSKSIDRYSGFFPEFQGHDKYAYEWQRCLIACRRYIQDANAIFGSIRTASACYDVINSAKGTDYIQGVVEIYKVVCRITASVKTSDVSNVTLEKILKDIDIAWHNLVAFIASSSAMPDSSTLSFSDDITDSTNTTKCGVCLLNIDHHVKTAKGAEETPKLIYGNDHYHSPCANFWVNCVESRLPALSNAEL